MIIPRIFQYADRFNRAELLKYATYRKIETNTPNHLYISDTFVLNDYRLCYIIFDKCICVLAKNTNDDYIYTGYTIYLRKVKSEALGQLAGVSHYVPTIILKTRWNNLEEILYYIHKYFESVFKLDIPFVLLKNFLDVNNFMKKNSVDDDDNGINEYERYYEQWVFEELSNNIEYFDI
jgi:hypothetical protein